MIIIALLVLVVLLVILYTSRKTIHQTENLDTLAPLSPNTISVSTVEAPIQAVLPQTINGVPLSSTTIPPPPKTIDTANSNTSAIPIPPGTSVYAEVPGLTPESAEPPTTAGKCLPRDGEGWSKPGGYQGTVLNSPCCQPPDYSMLDETLPTCDNRVGASAAVGTCLLECCQAVNADRGKYDASWYPMAKCGCALACNYMTENHFAKHGTAYRYVLGQPGDVKANDARGVATGGNWRGIIQAFKSIFTG